MELKFSDWPFETRKGDFVIVLNEEAFQQLSCVKESLIIPETTHLFEEPGKLEEVAKAWSEKYVREND